MQEVFWEEKARLLWHVLGDKNKVFFHRMAKIKCSHNVITTLKVGDYFITDPGEMEALVVDYFSNIFYFAGSQQVSSMVEENIPSLVDCHMNSLMTLTLSYEEIFGAVKSLIKFSAPGPDRFGGVFYHLFWDIIKDDAYKVVSQVFLSGWMLPKYITCMVILIPKLTEALSLDQFRPITLSNFKHKIITNVLADRLASLMPFLVPNGQRGFLKGRNIQDYTYLASEVINILDKKHKHGILVLKVDIVKVFDTIS